MHVISNSFDSSLPIIDTRFFFFSQNIPYTSLCVFSHSDLFASRPIVQGDTQGTIVVAEARLLEVARCILREANEKFNRTRRMIDVRQSVENSEDYKGVGPRCAAANNRYSEMSDRPPETPSLISSSRHPIYSGDSSLALSLDGPVARYNGTSSPYVKPL